MRELGYTRSNKDMLFEQESVLSTAAEFGVADVYSGPCMLCPLGGLDTCPSCVTKGARPWEEAESVVS